jgi:hypothetical protein
MLNAIVHVPTLFLLCIGVLGCAASPTPPEAPVSAEPGAQPAPAPSPPEATTKRPELTAEACEASGGAVVGDIGDGAVHRADYRCPSGAEPSGSIRPPAGGPIAVEGSVCCPK